MLIFLILGGLFYVEATSTRPETESESAELPVPISESGYRQCYNVEHVRRKENTIGCRSKGFHAQKTSEEMRIIIN